MSLSSTPWGALLVGACDAAAAAGCAWAALLHRQSQVRAGWRLLAAAMAGVALATLLRLETALIPALRALAREGGWYEGRRLLQVAALCVAAAAVYHGWHRITRARRGRPSPQSLRLATFAVSVAGGLCLLRLVSLHFTDRLIDFPLPGASLGRWLELIALALLAWALAAAPADAARLSWRN